MRLLVLSDIHGNWPALQAVAQSEKRIDGVLCLGDLVNYGPHPALCVDWAREHVRPGWGVQGNHDRALGSDEDPRCSAPYREMAAAMQAYTATQLSAADKAYLGGLPATAAKTIDGASVVLCHAAPSDPWYAYIPPEDAPRWSDEAVLADRPDFLLVGHTHLPFIRPCGGTVVVNPGSVGQPKDGDPRAAYAVWDDGAVELRRAAYDVSAVARDLRRCAPEAIVLRLGRILAAGGDG